MTAVLPLAACDFSSSGGRGGRSGSGAQATPHASFLDEAERTALRALVDRLIPPDVDPGAAAAGCAEAIDALLAAFLTDPPLIYAGGPFSDRGGAPDNDFLDFIPLDGYEEFAWRLVIEGSQGMPAREFNGPVKGMQQIYREGLAQLDRRARDSGFSSFAEMPAPLQDLVISDSDDSQVQELVDIAFPDTMDAMYGPPEYGGNRDLLGWRFTGFDGDTQPRGYTDEQVIHPDNPGPFDFLLPESYGENGAGSSASAAPTVTATTGTAALAQLLPAVVSGEEMAGAIMAADGSLARLRARLEPLQAGTRVAFASGRDADNA